ncbi:uncharacterized protein LOC143442147 [Arvicanthis niloticus]|uniref:uncharacterized protein LOC143312370 n=1 Tax=Arvicanthis niloticus TaxID=61156 RepID=UPI00402B3B99
MWDPLLVAQKALVPDRPETLSPDSLPPPARFRPHRWRPTWGTTTHASTRKILAESAKQIYFLREVKSLGPLSAHPARSLPPFCRSSKTPDGGQSRHMDLLPIRPPHSPVLPRPPIAEAWAQNGDFPPRDSYRRVCFAHCGGQRAQSQLHKRPPLVSAKTVSNISLSVHPTPSFFL